MAVLAITGGSRGIGRAVVLGAAARGWDVAFSYRADAAAAEETRSAAERHGVRCLTIQGDVRNEAASAALFDLAETLGPVDRCVVNAGAVDQEMTLAEMGADRLRQMVEVNLLGALFTAREAARRMPTTAGGPGGAMVLVSSAAARLGSPNMYVDYAAAKGGVDTLNQGLALELAAGGVRVNAVRPGIMETDIHADAGRPDRVAEMGASLPLGRAGTAEEAAETVLWLLSDAASYVTGANVDVAGGR